MNTPALLTLDAVHVRFPVAHNWLGRATAHAHALNGVSLAVKAGETLGIVGESGCGKSTLVHVLTGLLAPSSGALHGRDGEGTRMQVVFQDPQSSLDPRLPVWKIIAEPACVLQHATAAQQRALAAEVAAQVGLRAATLDRYPHEFSGGQRQRIAIARALAARPDIIVLDEPTSALDISVQAQILNLLAELQRERGLTYILISHNVSVVRHVSDRVAVMYLGQIVEIGTTEQVLNAPQHPYTRLLLDAVPKLGTPFATDAATTRTELPGNRQLPAGCFFAERCSERCDACERPQNLLDSSDATRQVRCHLRQ
ncbi:oligopeptide/dipeptide ABC transporter ATP-binding protein [Paludibacterium yongneupense]|uniref:oligopeptide/dipeptide ABC transporter ATP-binding protein n=1 Tax=Paludibacterium yongneupense TaxID=400061 RepID=UPI00040A7A1B|nr:oligopeptide/dipeptide ABC transporter ATP-binding protein [Paludibacterium yongneupense]